MLQRKQTLFLIFGIIALATLFTSLMYFVKIGGTIPYPDIVFEDHLWTITDSLMILIGTGLCIATMLFIILRFKNRPLQLILVNINILLLFGLMLGTWWQVRKDYLRTGLTEEPGTGPGMVAFVIAILCCLLASRAIRKDEEIVKSSDRLR